MNRCWMFIAFVGRTFNEENEWVLIVGDEVELVGYTIQLRDVKQSERPNHFAWIANLNIFKSGNYFMNLSPEKWIYFHKNPDPDRRQPHNKDNIFSIFREDVYAVFGNMDTEKTCYLLKS